MKHFSLENIDHPVIEVDSTEIVDYSDVTHGLNELETLETVYSDTVEALESLIDLTNQMKHYQEQGSVSNETYSIYESYRNHLVNSLGMTHDLMSLESFSTVKERLSVSLEENKGLITKVVEALKKIFKFIIDGIKKVWRIIVNFFSNISRSAKALIATLNRSRISKIVAEEGKKVTAFYKDQAKEEQHFVFPKEEVIYFNYLQNYINGDLDFTFSDIDYCFNEIYNNVVNQILNSIREKAEVLEIRAYEKFPKRNICFLNTGTGCKVIIRQFYSSDGVKWTPSMIGVMYRHEGDGHLELGAPEGFELNVSPTDIASAVKKIEGEFNTISKLNCDKKSEDAVNKIIAELNRFDQFVDEDIKSPTNLFNNRIQDTITSPVRELVKVANHYGKFYSVMFSILSAKIAEMDKA